MNFIETVFGLFPFLHDISRSKCQNSFLSIITDFFKRKKRFLKVKSSGDV